ncbi:MAG: HIT family protein [Deltaproteobacteria bacterium]|nr:HIT family protein [Deltaproteobacteria bacterium]
MSQFILDERLQADCIPLMKIHNTQLLLMNNSLVPWFLLVPETNEIELHHLTPDVFQTLMHLQRKLAMFIEDQFAVDKINTAAIGNVVSQLHVHVIGRRKDDHCWPGVIWGESKNVPYSQEQISQMKQQAINYFKGNAH